MNKLFCDLKTDEEKAQFFLSGRGYGTGVIAHSIQNDVAMAYHRCAEFKKELAALQAENDRLTSYYKNGIDCFANPCEEHSGERTPPFHEFFERYGGQCLICVVDNNKTLQAERDALLADRDRLKEALEGMEKWASSIYDGYPPSTASIAAAPYREAARAAIAKATGEVK